MIYSIFIVNSKGDIKLTKFWGDPNPSIARDSLVRQCHSAVSVRKKSMCNFIDCSSFVKQDTMIVYRRYNALYFMMIVDASESYLAMLDLIHYFVQAMDKCIPDVCELDIMINNNLVHAILDEMIVAGFMAPTSDAEVLDHMENQELLQDISKNSIMQSNLRIDQTFSSPHRQTSSLN